MGYSPSRKPEVGVPELRTHWKLLAVVTLVALFAIAFWLAPLVAGVLAVTVVAAAGVLIIPWQGRAFFGGYYFPKRDKDYYSENDKSKRP